jgi:hypothetical protein
MKLSEKTRAVCRANYDANCGHCPIRPECVRGFLLTQENLDRHIENLNEAAEGVEL